MDEELQKLIVAAIRADKKIGHGTCSTIDECYEDSELIEELVEYKIKTPKAAVAHFRKCERIRTDHAREIESTAW